MKSSAILITLILALGACTTQHPPGSLEAILAAKRWELQKECLFDHAEFLIEFAVLDPSYIRRKCRQYALSHTMPSVASNRRDKSAQ